MLKYKQFYLYFFPTYQQVLHDISLTAMIESKGYFKHKVNQQKGRVSTSSFSILLTTKSDLLIIKKKIHLVITKKNLNI